MSLKFTILGCGSSLGIPRIDGYYGNCDPKNKKNIRSRCSALIRSKNLNQETKLNTLNDNKIGAAGSTGKVLDAKEQREIYKKLQAAIEEAKNKINLNKFYKLIN